MPDRYIDEETETRTLSLCLFDIAGIAVLNRCANCPGAARAAIQHRRCPREHLQPNIFRPEDADSKGSAPLKSLVSSNKQRKIWHHEANTVLPEEFARLSLVDSIEIVGTFGQSNSYLDIPNDKAKLFTTPNIAHGGKRKAKLEDREESLNLTKSKCRKNGFAHLSVRDYLKLKPVTPLRDLDPGNLVVPGCLYISSAEMAALRKSSAASPMDTQEDRPSLPFVPGFCINTELDGCGLFACNDGIACRDDMEF